MKLLTRMLKEELTEKTREIQNLIKENIINKIEIAFKEAEKRLNDATKEMEDINIKFGDVVKNFNFENATEKERFGFQAERNKYGAYKIAILAKIEVYVKIIEGLNSTIVNINKDIKKFITNKSVEHYVIIKNALTLQDMNLMEIKNN